MAFRPIAFGFWTVLTCCCDAGRTYDEGHTFTETIISFDYIGEHSNNQQAAAAAQIRFADGVRAEMALQRSISIVRQQRLDEM